MNFTNRIWEMGELSTYAKPAQLVVVYGRRRVGKTSLITNWMTTKQGHFSQAIEGSPHLQISQLCQDLGPLLNSQIQPKNWIQFFELLEKSIEKRAVLCLDEFPYLVESDPTLPSIMQRFLDHSKNKKIGWIISGSSQKMMNSIFLNHSSPLFGRAHRVLKIEPMTYVDFCSACSLKKTDMENFVKYSMVGGLPKYWEAVNSAMHPIELADLLYFDRGALLENEPRRILSDEKVDGITPLSVLEAIGRGSHKPSEISSRIGLKQNSLAKVFSQLIDTSLIERQIPFGASEKNSKKTLYKISDPMLNFWYSVFSGLRTQWQHKTEAEKNEVLRLFASHVFENEARKTLKGQRYWQGDLEIDCIQKKDKNSIALYEIKFSKLKNREREQIEKDLHKKGQSSKLSKDWQIESSNAYDWTDYSK
ncbi:MAG: ATP-binding protein [Bdellovibrionaceae bacterium]|nr:ATP-binding protein [Pseudobdellovibrionaceae bacterium]